MVKVMITVIFDNFTIDICDVKFSMHFHFQCICYLSKFSSGLLLLHPPVSYEVVEHFTWLNRAGTEVSGHSTGVRILEL